MLCFGKPAQRGGCDRKAGRGPPGTSIIDSVTILLGVTVGCQHPGRRLFSPPKSVGIFFLGALSFCIATASGVLFAKLMNLFLKEKIKPPPGRRRAFSAVPDSARVVSDRGGSGKIPQNFLLMHAMAPNISGVIGSAIAAGVLWSFMS